MKKTDLSRYSNSWYKSGPITTRTLWHFVNALFFLNPYFPFSQTKVLILRLFGAKIGKGVIIKPRTNIKYPWMLTVGDHCWIGEGVWIDNLSDVSIGNNVCLSQGSMLLCGNHNFKKSTFDLIVQPIVLNDGVWIGAQSVVCPGVECGSHSVLTVKSVATKNLQPYTIYRGNPAVAVKEREFK